MGAWLFDEQQDASPLLDAVCRRLVSAPSVRWCYVVGDPFQAIYGFAGSSAECFLGWPVAKERIMPKSYRCPKPILELGAVPYPHLTTPTNREGSGEGCFGLVKNKTHNIYHRCCDNVQC